MADRVQEILNYYSSDNPGTKTNIARFARNSFQRPKAEAVKFPQKVMGIYAGEVQ